MENNIKTIRLSDIELENSPSFRGTITIDGKRYIVKKELSLSEHISSRLMRLMGIPVQNTSLAVLDNESVVLCEDFVPKDMIFVPSFKLFDELFPGEHIREIYDPIHLKIILDKYLRKGAEEALSLIIYKSIFDCIVMEGDFGAGNWGFLQGEDLRLAPFYDNAESMLQLMGAIEERSFSLEKAMDYAMREYYAPFICFSKGHIIAKEGFEDITNEVIGRFKAAYTVEDFCSYVRDILSSLSFYFNRDEGIFLYTALVLRYLHVIEGLGKDELLEVINGIPSYRL